MQKNLMFKCRVLFPELDFPFLSKRIALVLSCSNMMVGLQPCFCRDNLVHIRGPIASFAATNSASHKLVVVSRDSRWDFLLNFLQVRVAGKTD